MKRSHVLAGLLAAFACSGLEAQNMTAKIPFDFHVGPTAMPAGEYHIDYNSNRVLTVRSKVGNHVARVLMLPTSRADTKNTGVLEFRRYGNSCFFSGIWTPYSNYGGAMAKSGLEKELASRAGPLQPTAIALGGR